MSQTKFEVFLGTGGVGKTTLSYSRAAQLAKKQSVYLMTIDPSERLKDFIALNSEKNLIAEVFSPEKTFESILKEKGLKSTRISQLIMSKWGGMNELLSFIALNNALNSKKFEYVILDTAPGKHFTDFLKNKAHIFSFFSKNIVQFFKKQKKKNPLGKVLEFGIDKILQVLAKITGEAFVSEFTETLQLIFELEQSFKHAVETQENYLNKDSQWFLVFNAEQHKYQETKEVFQDSLKENMKKITPVINRVLPEIEMSKLSIKEKEIIQYYKKIHLNLVQNIENDFRIPLEFKEVDGPSINDHVNYLKKTWESHNV